MTFAFELDEEGSGPEDETAEDLVKKRKSVFQLFTLTLLFITGSIARSANLPVFSLLRGQF